MDGYACPDERNIMKKELEKNYNPSEIEDKLYKNWMEKKYFHAEVDKTKKPFTIVIPDRKSVV